MKQRVPTVKLVNGVEMPHIGLGTYPLYGEQLTQVVSDSYNLGYRLIDTADNYYNEKDLGESLSWVYANKGARREDFFIVTKVSDELYPVGTLGAGSNKGVYFWKSSPMMAGENAVRKILEKKLNNSLEYLKTDYLDLWLMHWPYPDFFSEIWYEMTRLYESGKVRAIGVCNCRERHFEKLKRESLSMPMVNQYESSPINTKEGIAEYCKRNDIQVMTYSPLMSLRFSDEVKLKEVLTSLAHKYKKNEAQILLRFDVQRGFVPIPKSMHKDRLLANIDLFDFELTDTEMRMLLTCNHNRQTLPESRQCPGL